MMLYVSLAVVFAVSAALLTHKFVRRSTVSQPIARSRKAGSEVRCFTCGVWIATESALEKKGRYFCGIKKNEREPPN